MKSERKLKHLKAAAWDAQSVEVNTRNTCETAWNAYIAARDAGEAAESAWDAYESAWDAYDIAQQAAQQAAEAAYDYEAEDK